MEDLYLPLVRSFERIIVVAGGLLCLWLGAKLFEKDAETHPQKMELSYKQLLVKLQTRGPAIFYAFFGSAILLGSFFSPVEITNDKKGQISSYKGLGPQEGQLSARQLQALNVVHQISKVPKSDPISAEDRASLAKTTNDVHYVRSQIVIQIVGRDKFDAWRRIAATVEKTPDLVSSSDRQLYKEVQKYFDDLGDFR